MNFKELFFSLLDEQTLEDYFKYKANPLLTNVYNLKCKYCDYNFVCYLSNQNYNYAFLNRLNNILHAIVPMITEAKANSVNSIVSFIYYRKLHPFYYCSFDCYCRELAATKIKNKVNIEELLYSLIEEEGLKF